MKAKANAHIRIRIHAKIKHMKAICCYPTLVEGIMSAASAGALT